MDYHSMKRSELQKLCKEHKIPANSANSVLADKLSELLNEKPKPRGRQRACIKSPVETIDESESAASRRKAKKVRFSPEIEYQRSGKKVDNVNTVADSDVQIPVKLTRSRAQILGLEDKVPTNQRKQGRKAIKHVEKETIAVKESENNIDKSTRSKAKLVEKESEPVKETAVVRARVTRSKGQTVTDDSKNDDLSPQVKKKSSKSTEKVEEKVVASKEVKPVPVRVTRSRGQTSNDESVVDNPPAVKKRTRKDDNVVANPPVEKKRTRRDTIVADSSQNLVKEDEGEKLGHGRRKKRSEEKVAEVSEVQDNADMATRQSRRNKAKVEDSTVLNQNESKVETVSEKKVTRSKANLEKKPSEGKGKSKSEVPLEEPAVSKNLNRRKSVIPTVKVSPKKDTRRKSVVQKPQVKEKTKPLAVNSETVKETETKAEAKSRKRRGDPIIEDQTIETEPVSTGKKSVAKKEQASGVKTPVSKKKAKLSGIKESDSDTIGTPVSKMANLELDDKAVETEQTPTIGESCRRFTRGAVKSDKKEPIQSVIKQKTPKTALLSSRKTPGRFTRSAIKIDEKKQPSDSTHKSQPLDDTEAKSIPDETIEVPSEVSKEANTQILEHSGDISMGTPISKMANLELDDKVVETEKTPAIEQSGRRFTRGAMTSNRKEPSQSAIKQKTPKTALLSSRKAPGRFTRSGIKVVEKEQPSESTHQSQPLDEMAPPEDAEAKSVPSEVSKEANAETLEQSGDLLASESVMSPTIDALSDGSHVQNQNQEAHVESAIPEISEKETELSKSGSTSDGLENTVLVEEQFVSDVKTVVIEESVDISMEQSDITGKSKDEIEDDGVHAQIDDVEDQSNDEDEKASNQKHEDVADIVDAMGLDSVNEGDDVEANREDTQEPLTGDDKLQGGLNDIEDEEDTVPENITTHNEPEKEFDVVEAEKEPETVTETSTAQIEPEKEVESDVVPSTGNDVHEIPILAKSDDEDEGADNVKEHESDTNDQDGESEQEQLTDHDTSAMEEQHVGDDEPEPEPVQKEDVPVLPELSNSPSDHEEDPLPELPEVSTKSPDQESEPEVSLAVDEVPCDTAMEESRQETNMDSLTSSDGLENEQKATGTSEFDEGVQSEENKSVPHDISNEQTAEDAELAADNDLAEEEQTNSDMEDLSNHDIAQENPTVEESSPIEYTKEESTVGGLPGDLGAYGSPTTEEESPTDDKVSNPPTSLKDDGDNQDWGNYGLGSDDFQKPVSANESDDVGGQSTKDPEDSNATEELFSWSVSQTTTQVSHVKDLQHSTTDGIALPDKDDDIDGSSQQYQGSSPKSLFKTPEATTQVSHVKDTQQSSVRFSLQDQDDTEVKAKAPQEDPDSSLKQLLKTPATSLVSNVKDHEQRAVRFVFPDKDAPANLDSSLKKLFETPAAATGVSHVEKHHEQSTIGFGLPVEDSCLKAMFATPAATQVSHVKDHNQENSVRFDIPDEDNTENKAAAAAHVPDSSLKRLFTTPATAQVSHVKDPQESTVSYEDDTTAHVSQQRGLRFVVPSDIFGEDDSEGNNNAAQDPDSSLKSLLKTPATTQGSHVKEVRFGLSHEDGTEAKATHDPHSSLKSLFATPAAATGRVSSHHVNDSQQSIRGTFDLLDEIFDQGRKQGEDAPQNQGLGVINFEEFSNKFFDDEQVDYGSGDNSGKYQADEMKQYDLSNESAAGTSHHDASGFKDKSVYSASLYEKNEETQPQVSETTGDEDSSLKGLFKTPGTTRIGHVKGSETRQNPTGVNEEDPKSISFEDFFGDDDKDGHFQFKQEAAGPGEGTRDDR